MKRRYLVGRVRAASRRRRPPRVAIIGAGFGGLATAVALRRAGFEDLVIIEAADGVGGTWRRNTYPGAACDIQSHLYSFSFAPNTSWSRTYATPARDPGLPGVGGRRLRPAPAPPVRHPVAHRPLERGHRPVGPRAGPCRGRPRADASTSSSAPSACSGRTKLPDIDGLADFGGTLMHTAGWDTGVDLTGKTGRGDRHRSQRRAGGPRNRGARRRR